MIVIVYDKTKCQQIQKVKIFYFSFYLLLFNLWGIEQFIKVFWNYFSYENTMSIKFYSVLSRRLWLTIMLWMDSTGILLFLNLQYTSLRNNWLCFKWELGVSSYLVYIFVHFSPGYLIHYFSFSRSLWFQRTYYLILLNKNWTQYIISSRRYLKSYFSLWHRKLILSWRNFNFQLDRNYFGIAVSFLMTLIFFPSRLQELGFTYNETLYIILFSDLTLIWSYCSNVIEKI